MGYKMWVRTYGNRIDKLEKMVWPHSWYWWLGSDEGQYLSENSSLEQDSSLHNQIYTWYYQSRISQ